MFAFASKSSITPLSRIVAFTPRFLALLNAFCSMASMVSLVGYAALTDKLNAFLNAFCILPMVSSSLTSKTSERNIVPASKAVEMIKLMEKE